MVSRGSDDDRELADQLGFPVGAADSPADEDYRDAVRPGDDRELTAMEMMGAPRRASESTRRAVLWIGLAFATLLFALTVGVIAFSGLDVMTLVSAVVLGFVIAAMFGALRYKGEDPMAQFDPPERSRRRRRKRERNEPPES